MTIRVDGQQYVWRFKYPGQQDVFSYDDMYVPVGMTVLLDITSDDVAHSWWIPDLGGKADALPGYVNHTWFKANEGRHVVRPVRRAVRAQPREHGRQGPRAPVRASGRRGTTGRRRPSRPPRTPRRSSASRSTRRKASPRLPAAPAATTTDNPRD